MARTVTLIRVFASAVVCLWLAACTGVGDVLDTEALGFEKPAMHTLLISSTRTPARGSPEIFTAEPASTLTFGSLAFQSANQRRGQINDRFIFGNVTYEPLADAHLNQINALGRELPTDWRTVLVYVHGYNNTFLDSTQRLAQIIADHNIEGIPVEYAWPSVGRVTGYAQDRERAVVASKGLSAELKLIAQTDTEGMVLLCHSLGSFVCMETLRDLSRNDETKTLRFVTGVVLAAPDIPVSTFETQLADIPNLPKPFAIFVSRTDQALGFGRFFSDGEKRLGANADASTYAPYGIDVVDFSAVRDGDRFRHASFATSPTVLRRATKGLLQLGPLSDLSFGLRKLGTLRGLESRRFEN